MEEEGFDYSFPGVHGRRSLFVQGVRKVHELNRHKRMEHMISAYRNAGWMSLILVVTVNHVVNDCKVCQKYEKSMARLRITLPKATSFNKVVTCGNAIGPKYN